MGSMNAYGFADAVEHGEVDLEAALYYHFGANHYPPLPFSLIPVAKRVIQKARAGNWEANVRLPNGITYRGSTLAPVRACVNDWHLDAFI